MSFYTRTGKALPQSIVDSADYANKDESTRREFLAMASAFGATAATAYSMLGMAAPANAAAHANKKEGGTMRMQMEVRALKDPRTYDWSQIANFSRGWLEYLAIYENDGTFEGNSMAGRFATLIDADTNKAIDGAIEVVDSHTVKLNLPASDITLIAGMADYPAAIVHSSFDAETMMDNPIGTGPYLPASLEVGVKGVLTKNADHTWWGTEVSGGPYLDTIEFIDYGTDPSAWIAAAEAEEVDAFYSMEGEYIDIMGTLDGWNEHEIATAATIVIRPNQLAEVDGKKIYEDKRVRQALVMAVDNAVLLELGYAGRGIEAKNQHVGPMHPEYADVPRLPFDPAKAKALMEEAGMADFEHELHSIDDAWRKDTTDAVAAQLRDAGIKVKRTILPGSTFWNDWAKYPFSSTNWNHRPLGVQVWALAYRSGEAWNEFGWSNAEFDGMLKNALATADVEKRRAIMAEAQALLADEGVTIQPYWRSLYNHTKEGLTGAEHHISFEYHPARIAWGA